MTEQEETSRPRRIIVTGASEGLGYRLANDYAARGHWVIATGSRRISDHRAHFPHRNLVYVRADQSEPRKAVAAIRDAVERLNWQAFDLLLLNAGVGWTGDPADEPADSIVKQVTVNLTAPVAIARASSKHLFAANGRLVLIGSTAAKGSASFATYAATKAALDAFARSLHEEWQGRATVQMIHPGPIRTTMHEKAGLKVGAVHRFFMPVRHASKAVQRAIRSGDRRRVLSRAYSWRSLFARPGEGEL